MSKSRISTTTLSNLELWIDKLDDYLVQGELMKVLGLSSLLIVGLALTGCSVAPPTTEEKLAATKEQLDCIYKENNWGGLIVQITNSQKEVYEVIELTAEYGLDLYREDLMDAMVRSVKPTRDLSWTFLYEFSDCEVPGMQEDATELGETLRRLADASGSIRAMDGLNIQVKSWEDSVRERDALSPIILSIQNRAEEVLEQCEALAPPEDPDC